MRVRPTVIVVIALVAAVAGCRRRALHGQGNPDASDVIDDAGADGAAPADALVDAGVDLTPLSPLKAAEQVEQAVEDLRRQRFVDCFGASPTVIAGWQLGQLNAAAAVADSRGRALVDMTKAAACLSAVARASCAEVVAGLPDRACTDLLTGTVSPGGACRADYECAGAPGQYRCEGDVRAACGGRCTLRPPSGERCGAGECAYGTICQRLDDGTERCVPSSLAGTPCNSADACGPNDYCRWRPGVALEGTCAPRVAGAPCTRPLECPFPYTCVSEGGGEARRCGVGLPVGASCRSYVDEAPVGPFSDCAVTLTCLPGPGGAWRCSEGAATGELCGTIFLPDGATANIPCRDGYCAYGAPDEATGRCSPFARLGGACAQEQECGPRRVCAGESCVPAVPSSFPVGASCPLGVCADGARCETSELGQGSDRTCVAPVADGQPCLGDVSCGGPFSRCQGGVCTPCD
jgi:hypothetical protein